MRSLRATLSIKSHLRTSHAKQDCTFANSQRMVWSKAYVTVLVRSDMNGFIPFKGTIKQTTETMYLALK